MYDTWCLWNVIFCYSLAATTHFFVYVVTRGKGRGGSPLDFRRKFGGPLSILTDISTKFIICGYFFNVKYAFVHPSQFLVNKAPLYGDAIYSYSIPHPDLLVLKFFIIFATLSRIAHSEGLCKFVTLFIVFSAILRNRGKELFCLYIHEALPVFMILFNR
jgi:hypothetical protein